MSYIRYVENFRIPMTGISRMLEFITELRDNNNREWFAAVKPEYEKIRNECYDEIDKLIALISPFDENLIGVEAKDCVYRIYRDIRFSADKSPFKTHFGIVLGKGGRKCWDAAYYLRIEPGECALYGGVWFPEQPVLTRLRHDIYDNIEEFMAILEKPDFKAKFKGLTGDSLKSMPKGFPKDCPYGDIIKMKEFLVMEHFPDKYFSNKKWQESIASDIKLMKPFIDFLNYTFEELRN